MFTVTLVLYDYPEAYNYNYVVMSLWITVLTIFILNLQDLAGLLKALYDAVGSSIKIPNNGTKTLKLRLSVGQDGAQGQGQTEDTGKVMADKNEKDSSKKKDLLKNKDNVKHKDSPKTKKKDITRLNNLTSSQTPPAKCNNETAGQLSAATRSRLSSKEHQELAELVQENMERNHIKQLRFVCLILLTLQSTPKIRREFASANFRTVFPSYIIENLNTRE